MKRSIHFAGLAAVAAVMLGLTISTAHADRVGGPHVTAGLVPGGASVFYDMTFEAGKPAIVSIAGNGRSILAILIYDSDGHVTTSTGRLDRQRVTLDVYRTGVFRVEVRNVGVLDNAFTLTTN